MERAFQTLQDRLVKALRLARISTIEAANTWMPAYWAKYNARFVRVAADSANAHRAFDRDARDLARVCANPGALEHGLEPAVAARADALGHVFGVKVRHVPACKATLVKLNHVVMDGVMQHGRSAPAASCTARTS